MFVMFCLSCALNQHNSNLISEKKSREKIDRKRLNIIEIISLNLLLTSLPWGPCKPVGPLGPGEP